MIELLADAGRNGFGVAAALDIERIPYRRFTHPDQFTGNLLVVAARELPAAARSLLGQVPTLVIGAPAGLPRELFGTETGHPVEGPATMSLEERVWPVAVRERAQEFGKRALVMPSARVHTPVSRPVGDVLASVALADGAVVPAVVRRSLSERTPGAGARLYWSLVELGSALADLMDEGYRPASGGGRPLSRLALEVYYRLPEAVRSVVQRRVYDGLRKTLAAQPSPADYPVDATGWLLVELLKALIADATGGLVRLARWPAPFAAAATLTHDLEPCRFAYRQGLSRMLERVERSGHPATFGVVARPAARYLSEAAVAGLGQHEVICHGLEHRGETVVGSREEIARQVAGARDEVERRLGRRVTGFRSPRLDRSADLLWALDHADFRFDSSYPDVDRENVTGFGGGVRLNLPFRPPIAEDAGVRPSACLELPVSAPDCIQPLFEGKSSHELRQEVQQKVAFIRATGGLYVGIVHAGVFGHSDADRREEHLRFVGRCIGRPDVWLASAADVARWWCARERLAITVRGDRVLVTNPGDEPVAGVRVVIEGAGKERVIALPCLAPGATEAVPAGREDAEDASLHSARPSRAGG